MSVSDDIPDDIMEAVKVIKELRLKTYLSRDEKETVNRAKLRIAYWACRTEEIVASRENLSYILGPDAIDIMQAYDKYIERSDKEKEAREKDRKRRKGGSQFWENA